MAASNSRLYERIISSRFRLSSQFLRIEMDPYLLGCIIFLLIEILGSLSILLLGKRGETGLGHVMLATAVVCCWSLWSIFYLAQLHPLVIPELEE